MVPYWFYDLRAVKIPAFSFSIADSGNLVQIYLQQSTFVSWYSALIRTGSEKILDISKKGSVECFLHQMRIFAWTTNLFYPMFGCHSAFPQSVKTRRLCITTLQLKQIFSNQHMIFYSNSNLISLYFSLRVVDYPRETDPEVLPLCRRTRFNLRFEVWMK